MYKNRHMNVNKLLENSHRSDLFGTNMASAGVDSLSYKMPDCRNGRAMALSQWDTPRLGMHGIFILGHQTNVKNALTVCVELDGVCHGGEKNPLSVMRNHWTPSYMDTVYRTQIDTEYYKKSSCAVIYEKKSISSDDVFASHLTVKNEKREPCHVKIRISMPFCECDGAYRVKAEVAPGALREKYTLAGFAYVATEGALECTLQPFESVTVKYAMAYSPTSIEQAKAKAEGEIKKADPFKENESAFNSWFDLHVPVFKCDDFDILKVYYYRYYLIYRGTYKPSEVIPEHKYKGECIYESHTGGWYCTVVDLPVPLQIEECRWLRTDSHGRSQTEIWTKDGESHTTYIHFTPYAVWDFYRIHPDREWLSSQYDRLFDSIKESVDIYSENPVRAICGSWPTGAEYQPSFYQYTDEKWDWRHDVEGNRADGHDIRQLYRLDALCFDILNLRAQAKMADELEKSEDAKALRLCADRIRGFVLDMYDAEKKFFFDRDEKTFKLCDEAPCYDGFTPFIDGIAGEKYYAALERLWDEMDFGDRFSVTTVSKKNPMYWFDNCITGPTRASLDAPKSYSCCWNGPVWPFANSLIALALGDAAKAENDGCLKDKWLRFFENWTELHFLGGDRSVPLTTEHYRPDDGVSFSSVNDYFHSSWINPFMKFWAGIDADGDEVKFSPFCDCDFSLYGVKIRGKEYHFEQTTVGGEKKLTVKEI